MAVSHWTEDYKIIGAGGQYEKIDVVIALKANSGIVKQMVVKV